MENIIKRQLNDHISVIKKIDVNQIMQIAKILVDALKDGKHIFLFGNGGSASDAQHLAAELCGKYKLDRDPLPAIAISSNISAITAIANDYTYDKIFERQLKAFANTGDVAIGISTSGVSCNVLKAIETAKKIKLITIAFTGSSGKLKDIVDFPLIIPSEEVPYIQEGYMVAGHIICDLVEREIFG